MSSPEVVKIRPWTRQTTLRLILSALFLAIGYVLPFATGQIREIGNMLLPMHLPVFLCGMICGWKYGAAVGMVLPITRSLIFGMPVLYPAAIAMSAELMTYGLLTGLIYGNARKKNLLSIYTGLLIAMVAGRLVWGGAQLILLGIGGTAFSWKAFMAGALLQAVPGIVLQLILIPAVMMTLQKTHVLPFREGGKEMR
ncbi:MAG: ECF transporter S component [Ruminococcaceae bacterium]|nr:ECF transporter S component [Oscillospiraceae bacterium]